jgi:FtsP/CotA-like multicopper oxidase with cupredoxin domain
MICAQVCDAVRAFTATRVKLFALIAGVVVCLSLYGSAITQQRRVVSPAAPSSTSLQPDGWDRSMRLSEAEDLNPDPRIVEVNLEARIAEVSLGEDKHVLAWTYNGQLPGPLIRAHVGDRVIVHFHNRLPEPTTVHWHGVRVPIAMDGVPGISQPPIKPGDDFTYDFVVPDSGLYWYHPHTMSAAQVGYGLYGPILVDDPQEDAQVGVADQLVLVLSDIGVEQGGKLEDPESGGSTSMAFGREGNIVLVNGRIGSVGKLLARSGAPQRWRILNAAKSRYFSMDFEDQPFTQIGSDGGPQEYPSRPKDLVLAPGERADILVTPQGRPGSELEFRSYLFNRGYGSVETRLPIEPLFTMAFSSDAPYSSTAAVHSQRIIVPLDAGVATRVKTKLTLEQLPDGSFQYGFDGKPYWEGKPFEARVGETQLWTIVNETPWSHPFHIHGHFFQVLDDAGAPIHPIQWKDTVSVPLKQTLRILVRFEDRPGTWMIHCHILDHADGGLMTAVRVGLPPFDGNNAFVHPHVMKY